MFRFFLEPLMTETEIIEKIIAPALDRADNEMPNFEIKKVSNETPLYGSSDAILDSLNLVTFVFIVEEEFERALGKSLKITTQDVIASEDPPFANLRALATFLKQKAE